ncbi:MAG: hypothetical protein O3A47_10135 [Chloroflexi bacterium]|nr:hypothetical protein [Chloroflexota bacterium]
MTGTLVVLALTATLALASLQSPGDAEAAEGLTIRLSETDVSALIGTSFEFTTEITNDRTEATLPLVAHLNVVSLDLKTYIDPEDWSPVRTLSIAPISPGSTATQTWKVSPILKGEVAVYIVVMEVSGSPPMATQLLASPSVQVHVMQQRTLNPGGVLPVVIAVPSLFAVAVAGMRFTRRRSTGAW